MWSEESYPLTTIIETLSLPTVVKIDSGYYGESEVDTFSTGDLIRLDSCITTPILKVRNVDCFEWLSGHACAGAEETYDIPKDTPGKVRHCTMKEYGTVSALIKDFPSTILIKEDIGPPYNISKAAMIETVKVVPQKSVHSSEFLQCAYNGNVVLLPSDLECSSVAEYKSNTYSNLVEFLRCYTLPQVVLFEDSEGRSGKQIQILRETLQRTTMLGHYKSCESVNELESNTPQKRTLFSLNLLSDFARLIDVNLPIYDSADDYDMVVRRLFPSESFDPMGTDDLLYIEFNKARPLQFIEASETAKAKPSSYKKQPVQPVPSNKTNKMQQRNVPIARVMGELKSKIQGHALVSDIDIHGNEDKSESTKKILLPPRKKLEKSYRSLEEAGEIHNHETKFKSESNSHTDTTEVPLSLRKKLERNYRSLEETTTMQAEGVSKDRRRRERAPDPLAHVDEKPPPIPPRIPLVMSKPEHTENDSPRSAGEPQVDFYYSEAYQSGSAYAIDKDQDDDYLYPIERSAKKDEVSQKSKAICFVKPNIQQRDDQGGNVGSEISQTALIIPTLSELRLPTATEPQLKQTSPQNLKDLAIFSSFSVKQLQKVLKHCGMKEFAKVCAKEILDGAYVCKLPDSFWVNPPYCLSEGDIIKLNEIKTGWRPKK